MRAINAKEITPSRLRADALRQLLRAQGYYDYKNFEYLQIGIFSLTEDASAKLEADAAKLEEEYRAMESTTIEQMWHADLVKLEMSSHATATLAGIQTNFLDADEIEKAKSRAPRLLLAKLKKQDARRSIKGGKGGETRVAPPLPFNDCSLLEARRVVPWTVKDKTGEKKQIETRKIGIRPWTPRDMLQT